MTQSKQNKPMELSISVKGEILTSNFAEFREAAVAKIDAINFDLATDEDFGNAKDDISILKDFETSLSEAEEGMLREMDDVYALITGSRELKEISSKKRLALNAKVTERQKAIKQELIEIGVHALHYDYPEFRAELEMAIKGKRSLSKMQEAINIAVKDQNNLTDDNRKHINQARNNHGEAVVFGESDLMLMETSALKVELERRVERHREAMEREALKKEAEAAKAEIEAQKAKEDAPEAGHEGFRQVERVQDEAQTEHQGYTPEKEKAAFIGILKEALKPVRDARAHLKHKSNIDGAAKLAEAFKTALIEFNREEGS